MNAAVALAVLDRLPGVAVRLQSDPGRLLEPVEDGFDLGVGRPVLRRPGDHAGRVLVLELVLELERVGDGSHPVGIAAANLDGQRHAGRRGLGPPLGGLGRRDPQVELPDAAVSHQRTGRNTPEEPKPSAPGRRLQLRHR